MIPTNTRSVFIQMRMMGGTHGTELESSFIFWSQTAFSGSSELQPSSPNSGDRSISVHPCKARIHETHFLWAPPINFSNIHFEVLPVTLTYEKASGGLTKHGSENVGARSRLVFSRSIQQNPMAFTLRKEVTKTWPLPNR
jgi:hypothetical protein